MLLSKRVPPPAPRLREERFNLQQQAARILDRLASGPLEFGALFGERPSRQELVFTFMALLELIRDGRVAATQEQTWGPIRLWRVPDAAGLEPA
ncbi:MAG: hypothetical protein IT204_14260 [Fimbriimonadaceae bacterium]|nr:hypothetical protein [Fimbriimonadaceae bacterium]